MPATNLQVQNYVDQRVRPFSEQMRNLYLAAKDHKALIEDIYAALIQETPTWTDSRSDGPPHLLTGSDILSWNTFISMFIKFIEGTLDNTNKNAGGDQYPIVNKACVRQP